MHWSMLSLYVNSNISMTKVGTFVGLSRLRLVQSTSMVGTF